MVVVVPNKHTIVSNLRGPHEGDLGCRWHLPERELNRMYRPRMRRRYDLFCEWPLRWKSIVSVSVVKLIFWGRAPLGGRRCGCDSQGSLDEYGRPATGSRELVMR